MNVKMILIAILISAGITFGLRALPFVIFRGERNIPEKMRKLGDILPSAIMAILIVYCLKSVNTAFWTDGIFQLIAVFVVFVTYKWKHNTLLSILLGTVCYMLLIRI